MADSDLNVTFSGDASNLNAAVAQARQTISSLSGSTSQAKGGFDALSAAFQANRTAADQSTSSWRANIATLADLTVIARNTTAALEGVAETMTKSAAIDASAAWQVHTTTMRADMDVAKGVIATMAAIPGAFGSAASAVYGYVDALAHGSGAARSFIHDQSGIFASMARVVTGAKVAIDSFALSFTGLARAELDAIMATGNGQPFIDAVGLANVKTKLDDFTASIKQIPDTSSEAAGAIEAMLATVPNYSEQANQGLINLIATISKNGDEATANATKISAALKDPTAASGGAIADMVGVMVDRLKASTQDAALFKAQMGDINTLTAFFAHTLQPASASAYFDAITAKLKQQNAASQANIAVNEAALKTYGALSSTLLAIQESSVKLERDANAERVKAIALLDGMKAAADQLNAVQTRQATFDATLEKANPLDSQIEAIQGKLAILQGQLNIGTGKTGALTPQDVETLVRTVIGEASQDHEQQLAVAAVALNRLANGNFGDSLTALLKAGNGTQFNTWKPVSAGGSSTDQANSPTPTSAYQYQEILHDIVQPLLDKKVADPTGGALNFYNPSITPPMNQFAMTGTKTFGSGDTAQTFGTAKGSPAAVDPMDLDAIEKTKQAIAALQDQLAQLNATKAGGTASDQAQLAITQQNAAGMHDEVAQAKLLLEAKQKDLATAQVQSPEKIRAAQEAVAQAQIELSNKEAAVAKANDELVVASAVQGSKAWLTATLAKYDGEEARAKGNMAVIADLEKQKLEAIKTYNKSAAEDAASTEDQKYNAAKRSLDDQMAALKANQSEGSLSALQVLDQTRSIQNQELDLEQQHLQKLTQIWAQFPTEYRKYQLQMAGISAQRRSEELNAENKFQQDIIAKYQQSMESITSTVSSGFMAMIKHTGNFRDLVRSVLENIVQQFMNAGLKIVADWVVAQTKNYVVTVATQAMSTEAVVAGNTAREASTIASMASQTAATAASFAKTILADASAAFAGVTAFLAPVMGPAAVGPAAGVEATVAAAASAAKFDIGSWSLPSSGLAMVHAGEMIVPAAQTPWAQSLMAAGGPNGSAGGFTHNGDVHIHQPKNFDDFVEQYRRNMPRIGRMLAIQQPGKRHWP